MQAILQGSSTAEQIGTNLLFSGFRPNQAGKPFLAPSEIVDDWRCWPMDFLLILKSLVVAASYFESLKLSRSCIFQICLSMGLLEPV
jgi:hypothetical protein